MRLISRHVLATALLAAAMLPAAADDIGVASCDGFLKTYATCVIPKMPEAQRANAATTLDQTRANWKQVASDADGKAKLDATCKDTTAKVKEQVASLNCSW